MDTTSHSLLERVADGTDTVAWGRFVDLDTPLLMRWCQRLGLGVPQPGRNGEHLSVRTV